MRPARALIVIACVLGASIFVAAAHAAVDVHASVDQDQVFVGEPFRLVIDVDGSQQAEPPSLQLPDGLDLRYVGPTTRYSSVNGRVSSSVSYAYLVTARREGRFSLGPFRVVVEGEVKETEVVTISVSPKTNTPPTVGEADSKDPLRIVVTPEKTSAYIGERLGLRLDLYVGDVAVDNLHFPVVTAEGFALEPFGQPTRREEIVRQRRWTVLGFRSLLTPLRAGTLSLGPVTMSLDVVEGSRRFGSVFDQFLGHRRPVEVRAAAVAIEVRPLPEEGRPVDFSGAVGQFVMEATATPSELRAGDPVTLHVEIRGVGNLESVDPPHVAPGDDRLRVYDPTMLGDAAATGKLTVEQVVIPRDETVVSIPSLRFSFFEPESGSYRTLTSGPFPIRVEAAKPATAAEVLSAAASPRGSELTETLGRDIVYIKERPGDLMPRDRITFYRAAWFAGLQLMPPALVLFGVGVGRRRRARTADSPVARFRRAGRLARRELAELSHDGRCDRFFDELTAVLGRYLGAKLDLPPGAVDRASVLAALERAAATPAARESAVRYFDLVERVRYAPSSREGEDRGASIDVSRALVDALERERSLAATVARTAAFLAIVFVAASRVCAATEQPRDPYTIFHDGNAAYRAGDYAGAAREYERLRSAGFESGALLYNLGNAYFKQVAFGRAILSYERARRLMPRDPDTRANLALARELAKAPADDPQLWQRILFAPALTLSAGELALFWFVLWCGLWASVVARRLGRTGSGLPLTLAVAATCVGASFAFKLWIEDVSNRGVVTASGQVSALFEPSETGKEHFRLPEGAVIEIRDVREGWVQVSRADGLRAWLPAGDVEPIGR